MGIFNDFKKFLGNNFLRDTEIKLQSSLREEYIRCVKKVQEEELSSDKFKVIYEFVEGYRLRKNIELETELFKIVGSYGIEDNLFNKGADVKRISRINRFNNLKKFMNTLTEEQIKSNVYLKATQLFMETSLLDCQNIIEDLRKEIDELEVSKRNQMIEINKDIPSDRLINLPMRICEVRAVPYYKPKDYSYAYVNVLDDENIVIYEEYNEYVGNINRLASDIYHLQMCNLLNAYSEEINNYHFSILNNEFEHKFMTSYFVKKCREKVVSDNRQNGSSIYQLSEIKRNCISRKMGISFEEIIAMDDNELAEYFGNKNSIDENMNNANGIRLVLKRKK